MYIYIYTVGSDTCQESKQMTFEVAHLVGLSFGCRFRITTAKNAQKHFGEQYSSDAFYGKPDGPIAGGDLILNTKNTVFVCSYCFFTYVYNRCINIYMCVYVYVYICIFVSMKEAGLVGSGPGSLEGHFLFKFLGGDCGHFELLLEDEHKLRG